MAILKLIFEYYHSTGPRKQENQCKNFIHSPRRVSPSLQILCIVFKLYFMLVTVPNRKSYVQSVGIIAFLVQCRLYVYKVFCLYVLYF